MRAFLLAAGRGTRISKSIPDIPKCTLMINGKPLIIRTIEMLTAKGIEVTVISGYRAAYLSEVLKEVPVNIVYNPFFDVTNSIASLYMARSYMAEEDTIIANADVFWSEGLLDFMLCQEKDVFMLADRLRADDGDYFFDVENDVIKRYGKELARHERNCEYVGIAMVKKSVLPDFKRLLEEKISRQEHGQWWENVLYDMTKDRDIYAVDVDGRFWAEIDFIEDYNRIKEYAEKMNDR